ncbi:hypothetical protein MGYG_09041 [Nannizzia gypsea CBS 118893]|uniref:Uncharacterized protein n=1 Tax=Arthroderma gypseum (strain ATCC MYA-4604 / CBS 118893) TaxID=535722 RepID=E4UV18_ARTGP|nr:hypothetical protein MGYG_09041 [Nannizzia gypsea CBS 118893]EFR01135.1 hypothetical protein MGYG_09041 [Nannizzia gypsea CBS 118893]
MAVHSVSKEHCIASLALAWFILGGVPLSYAVNHAQSQIKCHYIPLLSKAYCSKRPLREHLEALSEGPSSQLKQLAFKAPFHSLYYRWHLFEKLRKDRQDEKTKTHLVALYTLYYGLLFFRHRMDSQYGENMGKEFFAPEFRYIDCNGLSFRYIPDSVDIHKFEGVEKLLYHH